MKIEITAGLLLLLLAGCSSHGGRTEFMKRIDQVRPGMSRVQVAERLGEPDAKSQGVIELRPRPGPAEGLLRYAPAGTRYEQWFYRNGDSHYFVFFVRSPDRPDVWEVLTTRARPADAR